MLPSWRSTRRAVQRHLIHDMALAKGHVEVELELLGHVQGRVECLDDEPRPTAKRRPGA